MYVFYFICSLCTESSGTKPKSANRNREPNHSADQTPHQHKHHQQRRLNGNSGRYVARQRLSDSSFSASGTGLDYVCDGYAELNSVYVAGSKKQNLNHLLNFNYTPRTSSDARSLQRKGNHQHHRGRGAAASSHHHRYQKEQFLQASCQFVVRSDAPLGAAIVGTAEGEADLGVAADHLVDWSFVEQVHLTGTADPQCPICLHHPAAAKITRCGHVYCWPCVLHYMALSDQSWRKCPICFEAVHPLDLRSVVVRKCAELAVGDVVELQLMCRAKDSLHVTQARSIAQMNQQPIQLLHLFDANTLRAYSKVLLADPHEILSIVERERQELLHRRTDDGADCPESIFIEQALALLQKRQDQVCATSRLRNGRLVASKSQQTKPLFLSPTDDMSSVVVGMQSLSIEVDQPEDSKFVIDASESLLTLVDMQITPTVYDADHYYFYQAADAQLVYMHSLNTRMLQAQWCELRCAPTRISGRILQKDSCSMTDVLRKRLKYLQHLPVGSQFEIVEIQLTDDGNYGAVSNVVLDMFREEVESRARKRHRRATEDRKRDRQIDAANDQRLVKLVLGSRNGDWADIDVKSVHQFPMVRLECSLH